MRFWDASAIVPLFLEQESSDAMLELLTEDVDVVVWTLSEVEVASAFARMSRAATITSAQHAEALRIFAAFWDGATQVGALDAVKARARRLLSVHDLRAADSLQLAAALIVAGDAPAGRGFVCLDRRLADAAQREGFDVLPRD